MKFGKQLLLLLALGLLINTPVLGAEVRVLAPYFGTEENTYTDDTYGLDLRDSGPMKGLYFQRPSIIKNTNGTCFSTRPPISITVRFRGRILSLTITSGPIPTIRR